MDFIDPNEIALDELPEGFEPGVRWERMTDLERRIELAAWLERQRRNRIEDAGSWNGSRW